MKSDSTPRTIAERVAALCETRGWSHAQLSERAGLGRGAVNDLVNNPQRQPRAATVRRLAEALGVPYSYLTGATDEVDGGRGLVAHDRGSVEYFREVSMFGDFAARLDAGLVRGFVTRIANSLCPVGTMFICDVTRQAESGQTCVAEIEPGVYVHAYLAGSTLVDLSKAPDFSHAPLRPGAPAFPVIVVVAEGEVEAPDP